MSTSADRIVQDFFSKLGEENQLPAALQIALQGLAETGRLSDQEAIEAAVEQEDEHHDETEIVESEGSPRPPRP